MKRPHALWWAAPLAVGLCDRGPAASRATHPSDHRARFHTGECLLGARRHPLDDAAARAPAVPDDPDDDARARPPGRRPCPLAPLVRGGRTPSGEAGMVPLRLTLLGGFDARLAAGAPVGHLEQGEYLQIVESCRDGGRVRQHVIATRGRRDQLVTDGTLDSLLQSLARFSELLGVVERVRATGLEAGAAREIGALALRRIPSTPDGQSCQGFPRRCSSSPCSGLRRGGRDTDPTPPSVAAPGKTYECDPPRRTEGRHSKNPVDQGALIPSDLAKVPRHRVCDDRPEEPSRR
jgi:hypothetical protein